LFTLLVNRRLYLCSDDCFQVLNRALNGSCKLLVHHLWFDRLVNEVLLLFTDDVEFLLMDDILELLMNDWLVDLVDMFLVDDRLMEFVNDWLVVFVDDLFVYLSDDIFVEFMDHVLMMLCDDCLGHVLLDDGCLLVGHEFGFTLDHLDFGGFSVLDHDCLCINSLHYGGFGSGFA